MRNPCRTAQLRTTYYISSLHKSVMLNEVIEYLNIRPGSKIIDATLNGAGHAVGLLEKFPGTKMIGIEWDPEIFQEAESKIQSAKEHGESRSDVILVNDSYVNLKFIAEKYDFKPDGILFDLGVSSWHYQSGRGFSFQKDEFLDMRFNPRVQTKMAADVVNTYSESELAGLIEKYGEERFARGIASVVAGARRIKPITTTGELAELIKKSVPAWYRKKKIHPATKTFQALRMEVNDELGNIEKGVLAAIDIMKSGGRLVVISFHGLEDKMVKEIFKNQAKEGIVKWAIKGTVRPGWDEIRRNPRARSAKMKIVEKI